jgi:hypothetical protein
VYSRNKLGIVETNSVLKKEDITPILGGITVVLLINENSFFSSKNGPG